MKKSDVQILLVILGIAILVLGYLFGFKKEKEKLEEQEDVNTTLRAQLTELQEKAKMKDQLLAETDEYNKLFDKELTKYPADLNQETAVAFLKGVEEQLEFTHTAVSFVRPTDFYVLGQGTASGTGVASGEASNDSYVCQNTTYSIAYTGSYEGLKQYLDYIANYKYFMNISSMNIGYGVDEATKEELYTGSIILHGYSVSGPDRTPEQPNVDVPNGVGNIFTGNGSITPVTTGKYDSDQGASIVSDHDLTIGLVKANNDTTKASVIVASDENKEDTIVSYEGNDTATLEIAVQEKDGKNYVTYSIGDKQYEAELLSKELKILVASTARVDAEDLSGVKVNISNSTDVAVYIKVQGDDSTNPRFALGTKTGSVTVY
jgi:Tfp pilus assembly protein PilO